MGNFDQSFSQEPSLPMPDEDIHTSRECGGQVKTPSSLTNELHGQLQLLPCWGLQSPAIHVFRTFYPADFRQRV
ncbi:MAG: hypothetical protein KDC54_21705, partial [Lewinella sp.]|nr:hypothetical protein [Lewinella sp.]